MKRHAGLFSLLSPWSHQPVRLAAFLLATLIGLACAGAGLLAWQTSSAIFDGLLGPGDGRGDYLVIGKKADALSLVDPGRTEFSAGELASLDREPFVRRLLPVQHSQVPTWLEIDLAGHRLGTEIFFEAVPPAVLGMAPEQWHWEDGNEVPLLLPRSFLALFNMGYAASRGLPAIQESMLQAISLDLTVQTGQGTRRWTARIAGLTDRFSSFLVPEEFLEATNPPGDQAPRRLVLLVGNQAAPDIQIYLDKHQYEVHEGSSGLRQAALIASLLTGFFWFIGLVLWVSALLGQLQYLGAWLDRQAPMLETLVLTGFHPRRLTRGFLGHLLLLQLILVLPAMTAVGLAAAALEQAVGTWLPAGTGVSWLAFWLLPLLGGSQLGLSLLLFRRQLFRLSGPAARTTGLDSPEAS